ncbi:hypothetical protein [Glutamicibacter soli]|uniref:hypothetical protein n=1 Tax=Glutamicibacter soli TaxID=453836 RepID=UPI0019299DD8|nr:hypothetical protein [Glutamicibacter soli]
MRESTFQRWNASRERRGLPPFDPAVEYQLRPVPDSLIDIEVDTTQVAGRILAGLHEHRSQRPVLTYPGGEAGWERIVGREPAVVAWPPRPLGAPLLTDLFEGL